MLDSGAICVEAEVLVCLVVRGREVVIVHELHCGRIDWKSLVDRRSQPKLKSVYGIGTDLQLSCTGLYVI